MFCSKCGAQLVAGAAFCGACGNAVATTQPNSAAPEQVTHNYYVPPLPSAGNAAGPQFSSGSGTGAKSRTTAIWLAVLFGPWAWLYTYRTDKLKFWIAIGVVVISNSFLPFVGFLGFYIWSIVDVVSKNSDWYASY